MIPSHLIPALASAADAALGASLRNGAPGQATPTGEVGFVAAVVVGGVYNLAAAWRPILRPAGFSLQVSGVFCHQSPQVTFTNSHGQVGSCELADLLVVVDDITGYGAGRRWAVLIQAKMAASGGGQTLSGARDLRQLDLFSYWPTFTLPPTFSAGVRDFATCNHAGSPFDAGRYGLIARQPSPLWHQQGPAAAMPPGGDELGTFLARMVETGQVGFGREATGLADDWSRTVDELMTRTYASAFNYAAGFPGSQNRGHSAMAFATPVALAPFGWPGWLFERVHGPPPSGGRPDERLEEEPATGISVLQIGIGRTDEAG